MRIEQQLPSGQLGAKVLLRQVGGRASRKPALSVVEGSSRQKHAVSRVGAPRGQTVGLTRQSCRVRCEVEVMPSVAETIRSLKPNVSREDALRHFAGGVRGVAADFLRGRARSMAELYIPYHLFHVKIRNSGREETRIYALDAVEGTLDLFEFPELPGERELVTLKTRNALPCRLPVDRTREQLLGKVRRVVFSRGFARLRDLQMEAKAVPGDLYVPYWVCFRGDDHAAKLEIMDAVRRRPEGGKVRRLVEDWLRSSSTGSGATGSGATDSGAGSPAEWATTDGLGPRND